MKPENDLNWAYWVAAAFILGMAAYASNAKAEDELYIGGWSKHFTGGDYNEQHNLVGINYNSYVGAYFKNSYGRDTYLIGRDFRWSYKDLHAGVIAGLTYGYRECFGDDVGGAKLCPTPIPYIGYDATVAPKMLFSHQMVAIIGTIQF